MYAHHFGLSAEPFSLTPDPAFLYLSPGHAEALAALKVGLQSRRGLMVMTGEVGTGKTTLLYSLLSELGPTIRTAYLANTTLPFDDLLRLALVDFESPCQSRSRVELLAALNTFLLQCSADGVTAALVIDEAQNLDADVFENLRLLSNFETFTSKLLQIVLVGQPELEAKLRSRQLRQVAERVAVHCHVNPLTAADASNYVLHRLQHVGGSADLFTAGALGVVRRQSQGIPRRINIMCHNALLFAYGHGARRVSRAHVRAAVRERQGAGLVTFPHPRFSAWIRPALVTVGAVLLTAAAGARMWWQLPIGTTDAIGSPAGAVDTGSVHDHPAPVAAHAPHAEEVHARARVAEVAEPLLPSAAPLPATAPAPAVLPAAPTTAADDDGMRAVRVEPGTTLEALTRQVYGSVTTELLSQVHAANPQIRNPNHILAGDTLNFPEIEPGRPANSSEERDARYE